MAQFSARGKRPPTSGQARARAQRLELVIGILGVFTAMAAVQAVVLEVRGESAGVAAVILLGFVVALAGALKARRRISL